MAKLLGASFALLLIAALAAVSFAYPALFPNPLEPPVYDVDAAEGKASLDGTITLELRGSLSEREVIEKLSIEPQPPVWPPAMELEHIARLSWHEGFDWAKTRVVLNPAGKELFGPETAYSISNGEETLLSFETVTLPRILEARVSEMAPDDPANTTTNTAIVLQFNQPITWSDDLFEISPPSGVSITRRDTGGQTEVTIAPTSLWANETTYTLTVPEGVEDSHGHLSREPFRYDFTTWPAPSLVSTAPSGGSLKTDTPVVVQFERDVNRQSVEESFAIEPAATGTFEWVNERTFGWRPDSLAYSTRYKVSVAGNAANGDTLPSATWHFSTHDPPIFVEVHGSLQTPTILTASVSGGLGPYDLEWSSGEKAERILAVAPPGQTRDLAVTVRSGDQTATTTVSLTGPAVDTGHTPVPCPSGWEMIDISICYRPETLPGPVQTYITRVDIKDPAINLRTLPAADILGQAATVGQAARNHGAVAAVNGDFFNLAQQSYYPVGPMVSDGAVIHQPPADVPVLAIDWRATSWVGSVGDLRGMVDAQQVDFAVGGSHILLRDGQPVPVDGQHGGLNPRTALGVDAEGFAYLITVDGRNWHSLGMTLPSLQYYMAGFGIVDAINLDGGGSATMAINGNVVNVPSDGRERPVASVVEVLRH